MPLCISIWRIRRAVSWCCWWWLLLVVWAQHIIGLRVAAPRNECQAVDGVIGGLVARLISPSHTVPQQAPNDHSKCTGKLLSLPPISKQPAGVRTVTALVSTASSHLSLHQLDYTYADAPSRHCSTTQQLHPPFDYLADQLIRYTTNHGPLAPPSSQPPVASASSRAVATRSCNPPELAAHDLVLTVGISLLVTRKY